MDLPLGRNVTLYFFVAGLYLTSSMYGLLPPMIFPQIIALLTLCQVGAQHAAPLQRKSKLRPVCGLRAPRRLLNSLTIRQGARWLDSARRCACELICNRFRLRPLSMRRRWLRFLCLLPWT